MQPLTHKANMVLLIYNWLYANPIKGMFHVVDDLGVFIVDLSLKKLKRNFRLKQKKQEKTEENN